MLHRVNTGRVPRLATMSMSRRAIASTTAVHNAAPASSSSGSHPKPLYAHQTELPHLPVPTLSSTFHKYIETLEPLLSPEQFSNSKKLVNDFLASGQSKVLQERLEKRAADKDSWLADWWNEVAYMGYRGRIVPEVNYFYVHKKGLNNGKSQSERAADLVRATVEFKKLVDSERLEPEKVKGKPLCMASYKYLFNAVRVPTSPADVPLKYDPAQNHHVVVLSNDRFFRVDTEGRSASDLVKAFDEIKRLSADHKGPGLGVLTADDRDVWTEARRHLLNLSSANSEGIQTIESAILLVALDSPPPPETSDERAWSLWAGGKDRSPKDKGFNRWFDKHTIIVDSSGNSGFNGEHSMLDGTPTLRLNEFMLASLDKGVIPLELPEAERNPKPFPAPKEIVFELDAQLKNVVAKSAKGFGEEMALQDLKVVHFTGYGKEGMKAHKVSPDAYAQMIKQLAFYRLKGRPGVTYESCQTRAFLRGRTEVIRTVSNESLAFVKAFDDPSKSDADKAAALKAAATRHIQYASWAAAAQGIDRHMFGLKRLVKTDEGEQVPAVFTDEAFAKSSHWEMSTSNLGSKYLEGWGYGEVVADGYGLSYAIGDNDIWWCITTKNNDAKEFGDALVKAAEDINATLGRVPKA